MALAMQAATEAALVATAVAVVATAAAVAVAVVEGAAKPPTVRTASRRN
jgi:hypothetical protein